MEIVITFESGPVRAEVRSDGSDDYMAVLNELAEFVKERDLEGSITHSQTTTVVRDDENKGEFSSDKETGSSQLADGAETENGPAAADHGQESTNGQPTDENGEVEETENETAPEPAVDPGEFGLEDTLSESSELTAEALAHVVTPGTVHEEEIVDPPTIVTSIESLGDTPDERLLYGAAILLTILDEIHDIRSVEKPLLLDGLSASGLDTSGWEDMTLEQEAADIFFNLDMQGPGSAATVEVRSPGKEEALNILERLAPDDVTE